MNKKSLFTVVAICLLITYSADAQVTVPTNFSPVGTPYVGWSGAPLSTPRNLDIKNNFATFDINFFTNLTGINGSSIQRMVIKNTTGFVGINTTNPLEQLHVAGDINLETNISFKGANNDGYRINDRTVVSIKQNQNLFLGWDAGNAWTTGSTISRNTFVGNRSGFSNNAGDDNSFLGFGSGFSNTSGLRNVFIGVGASFGNTTGNNNTTVGYEAARWNVAANGNTMVGWRAGFNNTAPRNVFTGLQSGYDNTTGFDNAFYGYLSGAGNISGSKNCYFGANTSHFAGAGTGEKNCFFGFDTGHDITSGYNNTIVGARACYQINGGYMNFYGGEASAYYNKSGIQNTYVGAETGASTAALGSFNVFMGYQTGDWHVYRPKKSLQFILLILVLVYILLFSPVIGLLR